MTFQAFPALSFEPRPEFRNGSGRTMQPPNQPAKAPLRERNHLRRKSAAAGDGILGIRPLLLMALVLAVFVVVWFVHGLLTYPVAP